MNEKESAVPSLTQEKPSQSKRTSVWRLWALWLATLLFGCPLGLVVANTTMPLLLIVTTPLLKDFSSLFLFASGVWPGVAISILQWLVMRQYFRGSRWLIISTVSTVLSWAAGIFLALDWFLDAMSAGIGFISGGVFPTTPYLLLIALALPLIIPGLTMAWLMRERN